MEQKSKFDWVKALGLGASGCTALGLGLVLLGLLTCGLLVFIPLLSR